MEFNEEELLKYYHGVNSFVCGKKDTPGSSPSIYYTEFLNDVKNDELMAHLKFCNDVLKRPPVSVYAKYKRLNGWQGRPKLTSEEKKGLGACFGYIYQFGAYAGEYQSSERVSVTDSDSGIVTASYFKK